jgi:hypothetical protein
MSMKSSSRPADDELDRLVGLGITRQQVESGDDCLEPEVLASYADGGLSTEERTGAEAHLARCRDCRRALALQIESDPLVVSILAAPSATAGADSARGTARWPQIVDSAKTWLPLAAAVVVAAGLWVAFGGLRQGESRLASEPAQISARHESDAAKQAAAESLAPAAAQARRGGAAEPSAASAGSAPADRAAASRDLFREASPVGSAAAGKPENAFRTDADAAAAPSVSARQRDAQRDQLAAAARPNAEAAADKRARPAAAPAPAPPPPPSPPAALADAAAPARARGVAGQEEQAKVAGRLAPSPPPAASPAAPQSPAAAPEQTAAANQQNVAQQAYVVNQQTGPMSNLNIAPPPAKADERRQAERSKTERAENEKTSASPSGAKSADGAFAKPAGTDRNAASGGAAASDAAGARAAGTSAGAINEAVTVVTSAPASASNPPVLRSVDGARWWRIRAPSTIEGSTDRGATWTVEYSEPSARLVRGAAAAKGGCWMIGANGLVLRARPTGGWERVMQPTTRNLVTLTATDHLIAAVSDDQGRTYRTTDGGATWR